MRSDPRTSGPALRGALLNLPAEPDETWTTADGRVLAVGQMDEAHARNVLRMLLRKRRRRIERLRAELADARRRQALRRLIAALPADEDVWWGDD
jgi:hypothetical protein